MRIVPISAGYELLISNCDLAHKLTEAPLRSSVRSRVLIAPVVAALLGGIASASPGVAATASRHVKTGAAVQIADVHCKVGVLLHQGKTVYAGVPASCGALPLNEGVPQWGCGPKPGRQAAASAPVGTPVRIAGAKHRALLAYDSFTRMQAKGILKNNPCQYNDLILLKLTKADSKAARSTVKSVMANAPSSGTSLRLGTASATAAASTHNGWVYPLSKAPTVTASQVGTPLTRGSTLIGMLTAIPQGTIMKTPAAAYNLSRAIKMASHAPCVHGVVRACFNHLKLLKG